jgi:hypothetical protein
LIFNSISIDIYYFCFCGTRSVFLILVLVRTDKEGAIPSSIKPELLTYLQKSGWLGGLTNERKMETGELADKDGQ